MSDLPLLIAGLGNPGETYARHRHNVGFMAVDAIAARHRFGPWRAKYHGHVAEGTLGRTPDPVAEADDLYERKRPRRRRRARFLKLDPGAVVVIHDELDLVPGKLRAKTGGGDAGHNGLRSITATLGPDYRRVRIGIGHPGKPAVLRYALHDFSKADREWLVPLLDAIADAAPYLAEDDDPDS